MKSLPSAAQDLLPITTCGRVYTSGRLANDLVTTATSCLTVNANNVTIDGAGHSITAAQFAIQWVDRSGITIKNVVSTANLQIYGAFASKNVVTDSTFNQIAVYRGDDNVVRNSRMGKLLIYGMSNDPAQRATVTGNVITRTLTKNEEKLVEIVTGLDGTREVDGTYHCARGDHYIADNDIIGNVVTTDSTVEPELLYLRCGMYSTVTGNRISSPQKAAGILLRDGADANLIENNDVHIGVGNEGALLMQSGSAGYHHPRDNVFRGNTFRVDQGRSTWIQASQTRGNTFLNNVFRTDGGSAEMVRIADGVGVTTLFDHNTFYRTGLGTLVIFRDLNAGSHTFTSNIFMYGGSPTGVFDFDKAVSLAPYHGDYNVFFNSSGPVTFGQYGITLPVWQSAGLDPHSVEANPGFVSPGSGDFDLSAGSAVIGDGANGTDPGASPVAP